MNYRRQFVRSIFIMHITFATPTEWGHQRYWVIITNAISEIVFLLSYYVGVAVSHRQRKQMHKHTHMRHNTYSTYTLGRHRTKKTTFITPSKVINIFYRRNCAKFVCICSAPNAFSYFAYILVYIGLWMLMSIFVGLSEPTKKQHNT